jgi:hypothetical protein
MMENENDNNQKKSGNAFELTSKQEKGFEDSQGGSSGGTGSSAGAGTGTEESQRIVNQKRSKNQVQREVFQGGLRFMEQNLKKRKKKSDENIDSGTDDNNHDDDDNGGSISSGRKSVDDSNGGGSENDIGIDYDGSNDNSGRAQRRQSVEGGNSLLSIGGNPDPGREPSLDPKGLAFPLPSEYSEPIEPSNPEHSEPIEASNPEHSEPIEPSNPEHSSQQGTMQQGEKGKGKERENPRTSAFKGNLQETEYRKSPWYDQFKEFGIQGTRGLENPGFRGRGEDHYHIMVSKPWFEANIKPPLTWSEFKLRVGGVEVQFETAEVPAFPFSSSSSFSCSSSSFSSSFPPPLHLLPPLPPLLPRHPSFKGGGQSGCSP